MALLKKLKQIVSKVSKFKIESINLLESLIDTINTNASNNSIKCI
jgi:hypothetical protein